MPCLSMLFLIAFVRCSTVSVVLVTLTSDFFSFVMIFKDSFNGSTRRFITNLPPNLKKPLALATEVSFR